MANSFSESQLYMKSKFYFTGLELMHLLSEKEILAYAIQKGLIHPSNSDVVTHISHPLYGLDYLLIEQDIYLEKSD